MLQIWCHNLDKATGSQPRNIEQGAGFAQSQILVGSALDHARERLMEVDCQKHLRDLGFSWKKKGPTARRISGIPISQVRHRCANARQEAGVHIHLKMDNLVLVYREHNRHSE